MIYGNVITYDCEYANLDNVNYIIRAKNSPNVNISVNEFFSILPLLKLNVPVTYTPPPFDDVILFFIVRHISSDIRPEDITIKKMVSWAPKGASEATRIYVDAVVKGKQFNY